MAQGTSASLELIPSGSPAAILSRLKGLLAQAERLRGVVAYWTIRPELLGLDLVRCLARPDAFICVDIHGPTNIDYLASLRRAGANVYLHLYDLAGQTEDAGTVGMPPYLLHAKTLLFDTKDAQPLFLIGSHNWTQRALFGVNIEASLIAELTPGSPTHRDAEGFLELARARCQLLDPSLVGYYKWLQGADGASGVIELEDAADAPIPRSTITVFGTALADYKLKSVDKEAFVSITSASSRRERFYRARIDQTGKLERDVTFDPRRYALRDGGRLPVLQPLAPVPAGIMNKAKYFVTLALQEELPTVKAFDPPTAARWVPAPEGEIASLVPEREWSEKRRDRAPRLRVATSPANFEVRELSLEERRAGRDLVTRRIIVGLDEARLLETKADEKLPPTDHN